MSKFRHKDATQITLELLEKDPDKLHMLIYTFFKRLLREWEQELNNRPDNVKRSTQGKLQAAIQRQTTEYLKPFFRTLKKKVRVINYFSFHWEISKLLWISRRGCCPCTIDFLYTLKPKFRE